MKIKSLFHLFENTRPRFRFLFLILLSIMFVACTENDNIMEPESETWQINNLDSIGGHDLTVIGNPEVVDTVEGGAIFFDGDGDRLQVHGNPVGDTTEFTVEVIFWQEASHPDNAAPRFIHIQDPNDPQGKRILIELRVNEANQWYLDGFMKTDNDDLTLIDETLVHPTEQWMHAAVTYKDSTFTTYVNGVKELSGTVVFDERFLNPDAEVSIGGRMNDVAWFRGMIKSLKVTQAALEPDEFTLVNK